MNFQGRFSKSLKFLNHVLQLDGTFTAVEIPGPPNFDAWSLRILSWKVYVNTLMTFEVELNHEKVPVVSLSAMEEYHDTFRELVKNYPEAWHLLVIAEDRCRDREYGDRHVREPALLFRTSGKHKEQPGGSGTGTDLAGHGKEQRNPKARASQKERLKKQLAKLKEESDIGFSEPAKPAKGTARTAARASNATVKGDMSPTDRAVPFPEDPCWHIDQK